MYESNKTSGIHIYESSLLQIILQNKYAIFKDEFLSKLKIHFVLLYLFYFT